MNQYVYCIKKYFQSFQKIKFIQIFFNQLYIFSRIRYLIYRNIDSTSILLFENCSNSVVDRNLLFFLLLFLLIVRTIIVLSEFKVSYYTLFHRDMITRFFSYELTNFKLLACMEPLLKLFNRFTKE